MSEKASPRLQFNPKVRLAFHGATITTDAGLLAFRGFDDALGLTEIAEDYPRKAVPDAISSTTWFRAKTVDLHLATTIPMTQCGFPKTQPCEDRDGKARSLSQHSEMGRFETDLTQDPAGAGTNEYPLGGTGDGPHPTPASYPGYG